MKRIILKPVLIFALLAVLSGAQLFADTQADYGALGALESNSLTLQAMLDYAIQDEYLAKAEYELIMDKYGEMRPFSNIIKAEERHIEWVVELFSTYGFSPAADQSAEYVILPPTLKDAFATGVQAEIDNIAMYEKFLKEDLPEDVRDVFERLKAGSENHLRSFQNNLQKYN
jgi:hypothetical protein